MPLSKRLKALQGSWVETKGKGKTWVVEDDLALSQEYGRKPRRYPLTKGENGEVIWGQGKYILDLSFKAGDSIATWWDGDAVGFSWERLEAEENGEKSSTHTRGEKRIDPFDGKSYTLDEMRTYYSEATGTPKIESTAYWFECKPASGVAKAKAKATSAEVEEHRIDPSDGSLYTYSEMRSFYSDSYTKKQMEAYWADCKVKAKPKAKAKSKSEAVAGETHTDSANGKSYTWEELRSLYSNTHTKKEASYEAYWEECESEAKMKAKSKAKAKPKAKPKSKAEAKSIDWMQ